MALEAAEFLVGESGLEWDVERNWAQEEFGGAVLGNKARTRRLVEMVAQASKRPAGQVTQVFDRACDREGAYRFLESPHVKLEALVDAMGRATSRRCMSARYVYVPIDETSLGLKDPHQTRGTGCVGSYRQKGRGFEVMTAMAVEPSGCPAGLLAQTAWARTKVLGRKKTHKKRKLQDKESRYWLQVAEASLKRWKACKAPGRLWFQMDRGADFWELLTWAAGADAWVTVRSSYDRRLALGPGVTYLREHLAAQEPLGSYMLHIPDGDKRTERWARVVVRSARVPIRLRNQWTKAITTVHLNAVMAQEEGPVPKGEKRLVWYLLTTAQAATWMEALAVIRGYATRWRIEEFHRAWKSVCNVEDTRLHSSQAILRWSTILVGVSMRIERLKYMSRTKPEEPATIELKPHEVDALVLLWNRGKKRPFKGMPTISQAVEWIASLGGYSGRSSAGGPPGAVTIGRGLAFLKPAAEMLWLLRGNELPDEPDDYDTKPDQ